VLPVFQLIQKRGNIDRSEMFHVFNMGIGIVVICSPENTEHFTKALPEARVIGEVIKQGEARVVIN
jgi:phosphoribosylformylglycinamidine cyclo-ligase